MAKPAQLGVCEECHKLFEYSLWHNGVNNSSYAYCERCGKTAILDISDQRFPVDEVKSSAYQGISAGVETHLMACHCGGFFLASSQPRCPHCEEALSAAKAATYIERQPPQSSPDWRWQMNWRGTYCIVIEAREVRNNFK
jgi:uncharacterized paraquat-inducible protein A